MQRDEAKLEKLEATLKKGRHTVDELAVITDLHWRAVYRYLGYLKVDYEIVSTTREADGKKVHWIL